MEKCYEYFGCTQDDCPNKIEKKQDCWNIENTLRGSNPAFRKIAINKDRLCKSCIYYQTFNKGYNSKNSSEDITGMAESNNPGYQYKNRSLVDRRCPVNQDTEILNERRAGWEKRYAWKKISKWHSSPVDPESP